MEVCRQTRVDFKIKIYVVLAIHIHWLLLSKVYYNGNVEKWMSLFLLIHVTVLLKDNVVLTRILSIV